MSINEYIADVLVVGGGPAGSAAALELARADCNVVLLERNASPIWKIGETLPPESRVHLQRLGHWETFQAAAHRPCHGIVSCWGSDQPAEVDFLVNPYGHGWQLDRVTFETDLLRDAEAAGSQVRCGVEIHEARRDTSRWRLETSAGVFFAPWLLDCSGPRGVLATQGLGGGLRRLQDFAALYVRLRPSSEPDRDGRTYVESYSSGWAYSSLTPSGERVVALLTDRDLIPPERDWHSWMMQCIGGGTRIHKVLERYDEASRAPVQLTHGESGHREQYWGEGWMLVGDSAMTFDPLSGWGVAKALVSAAAAVDAVLRSGDYPARCRTLWSSYLQQYRDYYLAERRWPEAPFWARRQHVSLAF